LAFASPEQHLLSSKLGSFAAGSQQSPVFAAEDARFHAFVPAQGISTELTAKYRVLRPRARARTVSQTVVGVGRFGILLGVELQNRDRFSLMTCRLELNTARWDLVVLWTLPVTGILMLLNHAWWPYLALVNGGVYVDTAGRETAKVLGLSEHGVRTGSGKETRLYFSLIGAMALIGLWCIAFALVTLT
jgi:hypothetical protein